MIQEQTLIPYQTSPLPEGPWIVFSPHPDDETFGMGGTLLLASKEGVKVTLVVLTDGSMGGEKAESGDIVSIREKEAVEVSKQLQLAGIAFWRHPDRGLSVSRDLVTRVAELIREVNPGTVFFPSPMELHPDHRTASTLVWEGLRNCPTFNGNAYAYEISVQCPANRLIDITAVAHEKRALATLYRSQIAERDYLSAMLALNKTRSYTLPPQVLFAEAFFSYERIGETDLSFHTLNNLRPYWADDSSSQEEERENRESLEKMFISAENETEKWIQRCKKERENRESLEKMLISAENEAGKWIQRCKDMEKSRIWRCAKPMRTAATAIELGNRHVSVMGRRWKDYFKRFFRNNPFGF